MSSALPLLCQASLAFAHRWQEMAVTAVGYWVPLIYCAVLAVAGGSIKPGLCVESTNSLKVSRTSPLCLLLCTMTVLPPALTQWGLEFGLFVLFIMHPTRKQQNFSYFFFLIQHLPKPCWNYLQNQADASAGVDSQQAGVWTWGYSPTSIFKLAFMA